MCYAYVISITTLFLFVSVILLLVLTLLCYRLSTVRASPSETIQMLKKAKEGD